MVIRRTISQLFLLYIFCQRINPSIHKRSNMKILLYYVVATFGVYFGTLANGCIQSENFDQSWPSDLQLIVFGPTICYTNYLCVWKFEFTTADVALGLPAATLNFNPSFNSSFFYTLSTNELM